MKRKSLLLLLCSLLIPQQLAYADLPSIPVESPQTGPFSWFDLITNDLSKSKNYYQQLLGWTITRSGDDGAYSVISNKENTIGGIAEVQKEPESAWLGLMLVPDLDATIVSTLSAGGQVLEKPQYVANRGVMTILKDNVGAVFVLLEQNRASQLKAREARSGDWIWSDIFTSNISESLEFYKTTTSFSHSKESSKNSDNTFMVEKNRAFGVVKIPWDRVTPAWLPYVLVDSIDATIKQSELLGGKLFYRIKNVAILLDPTGAAFGIQQLPK